MATLIIIFIIVSILLGFYAYWRFIYFFRDPDRVITKDDTAVVSPADGTIIYIKEIADDKVLFATKKGRSIPLTEYCQTNKVEIPGYLVGIFMHPTSVHVNRAPISGEVVSVDYKKGSNLPMTITWWRTNLKMRPAEKYATHIISNERNIIGIEGRIKLFIVQIADIYVNRIESWVKVGETVTRGQRVGMIKFGSQVDLYIPSKEVEAILAKVGDKVTAGESILAKLKN